MGPATRPCCGAETSKTHFTIRVVDEQTGRGVPLVELKTVNSAAWWTDSAGLVAFDEPGLMGKEVFFHISSPGYEYPKDFFDNRGLKLRAVAGGRAEVKLKRTQIAERLYRITGQGIYRDSVLAGEPVPLKQPVLNGQVLGQDTVIVAPYRGKLFWFWGDTDRASYPLGNFGASGATSELPERGGLDPAAGVDLTYFTGADGFSKPMCPDSEFGEGLKWIESVMTVRENGSEKLLARVAAGTGLEKTREWHLAQFNDDKQIFESLVKWDLHDTHDSSHPFRGKVDDVEYLYLFPDLRVLAKISAMRELKSYEAFTCVAGDGKWSGKDTVIDRDAAGRVRYSWKAGAQRLRRDDLRKLTQQEILETGESWLRMLDVETGKPVETGRGSVFWNDYRHRWVMIGSGDPGEIWFSEADTPTGPWVYARRIAVHGRYNFYNPTQHPHFDQDGGRIIYFEGTYTDSFSGAPAKTPRYDYNQIMYRLALDDPRLNLPVPVYRVQPGEGAARYLLREGVEAERMWEHLKEVAFFAIAPARRQKGLVPVYSTEGRLFLQAGTPAPADGPLFLALPAEETAEAKSEANIVLHQVLRDEAGKVLCRVWKNPINALTFDFRAQPVPQPPR